MLAAIFISGGINALRAPQGHAAAAKPVLEAAGPILDKVVDKVPLEHRPDDETLVKLDAVVKVVAGSMLEPKGLSYSWSTRPSRPKLPCNR